MPQKKEVIIIGSGLAALVAASFLTDTMNVRMITKEKRKNANSMMAQGGIAAVIDSTDTLESHITDTIIAGNGINNPEIVELVVSKGSNILKELIDKGVPFDRKPNGELSLGLEGAHSHNRIAHIGGDTTGFAITNYYYENVKDKIILHEDESLVDLILENGECVGVVTKNDEGILKKYYASAVILSSGGIGGMYQYHSNDSSVVGEGTEIAYENGCLLADLEFVQFHPTLLYKDGRNYGLVSEAVRGEGAQLVNSKGERIMLGVHELLELAPRDIVARKIEDDIQNGEIVYLDIRMIDNFEKRFPTINKKCQDAHVSVEDGFIPVAPGAHFHMGGVMVDEFGQTNIENLYAIGEVSRTGLHGGNRLASNSLLEAIVFGKQSAEKIIMTAPNRKSEQVTENVGNVELDLPAFSELQAKMSTYMGINRNHHGLVLFMEWLLPFTQVEKKLTYSLETLRFLRASSLAYEMADAALMRTTSIGGHYRSDASGEMSYEPIIKSKKMEKRMFEVNL